MLSQTSHALRVTYVTPSFLKPHPRNARVHSRKQAAQIVASIRAFGFAGDTDWHEWEDALLAHDIIVEPIIEAWSRAKHAEKQART